MRLRRRPKSTLPLTERRFGETLRGPPFPSGRGTDHAEDEDQEGGGQALPGDRYGPRTSPQGGRQTRHAGEVAQAPPPPPPERHGAQVDGEAREAASPVRLRISRCPAQKEDSSHAAAVTAF